MSLPAAHLADHWLIYVTYSLPVVVVVGAIAATAIRERARRKAEDEAASPEARPGDGPANP